MDAHRKGKGYGKETLEFILKLTKRKGYKFARGYTEFQAVDSQNMLRKLKFKETDSDEGKYFERKL
jgi:GNAT superfamily N-acetyltransferase